jgi:hypothetical protein
LAGQEYIPPDASDGMPGLESWQLNPSRPPEPVQLPPHETSFSRTTLTHLPLLHWLSLEQKQPPDVVHWFDAPLQVPDDGGQENPVGMEVGQPPSGHAMPESPASPGPPVVQAPLWHVMPAAQAKEAPQPPQLALSFVKLAQASPHDV